MINQVTQQASKFIKQHFKSIVKSLKNHFSCWMNAEYFIRKPKKIKNHVATILGWTEGAKQLSYEYSKNKSNTHS